MVDGEVWGGARKPGGCTRGSPGCACAFFDTADIVDRWLPNGAQHAAPLPATRQPEAVADFFGYGFGGRSDGDDEGILGLF